MKSRDPDPEDYYAALEITPSARKRVIDAAFRELSKDYHPDLHPGDPELERRMKLITKAHRVLSDPVLKRKYDLDHGFSAAALPHPARTRTAATPSADHAGPPILAIEPSRVELRPGLGDQYVAFSVRVRQVAGPAWDSSRHVIDVDFDEPWRQSMFTKVHATATEPPLNIDFELRLSDLRPAERHAGTIRVEAHVVTVG